MAKERLYVDPKFKKMLKLASIENDDNVLAFTKKVVEEPEILVRYKNKNRRYKTKDEFDSFF